MSTQTRLRLFCATSVAAICAVGPASAQSAVSRDKVDALEAQLSALQQELRVYGVPVFVHTSGIPSIAQTDGRFEGVILATAVGAVERPRAHDLTIDTAAGPPARNTGTRVRSLESREHPTVASNEIETITNCYHEFVKLRFITLSSKNTTRSRLIR